MEPVLIQSDPSKINEHIALLPKGVAYLQQLYDAFLAKGLSVTIVEMKNILHPADHTYTGYITDFFSEKMLENIATPVFGGIPIKREKLAELIDLPEINDIELLIKNRSIFTGHSQYNWCEPGLYQITDGVVSTTVDAEDLITARHNYYTTNDRGVETTNKINGIISILQEYKTYAGQYISDGQWKQLDLDVLGIENYGNYLRPSLQFIRDQEKAYPEYVAV